MHGLFSIEFVSWMELTSILIFPKHEHVHGSDLGYEMVGSVEPEDLLRAVPTHRLLLHVNRGAVVPIKISNVLVSSVKIP